MPGNAAGHQRKSSTNTGAPHSPHHGTRATPNPNRYRDQAQWGPVSTDVAVVLLFTLAGFLIGGAYTTWKTARPLAVALGVCAVLAALGAVLWLL